VTCRFTSERILFILLLNPDKNLGALSSTQMAPSKTLQKLVDRVTNLKSDLKEANADLKAEIESTPLYKAFFDAIKETLPDQVPDKAAHANAYKLTLSMLTKKEDGASEDA